MTLNDLYSNLDFNTLLSISFVTFLFFAIAQIAYGYFQYRFSPALDMGIASLLFALRSVFYLHQTRLPEILEILPILAIGFEVILIYRAIRSAVGKPPLGPLDIPFFFGFMVLGFLSGLVFKYSLDQIVHSAYVLFFFSRAFAAALQALRLRRIPPAQLIIILFYTAATCVVRLNRAMFYLFHDVPDTVYVLDPRTVITTFYTIMIFLVGNIGVFFLSITRLLDEVTSERDFAKTVISVIGHDLNGYIGSIRQTAELVTEEPEVCRTLVENNASKAQHLLTDLVFWSKARKSSPSEIRDQAILRNIINSLIRDTDLLIGGKNVTLDLPEDVPPRVINGNPVEMSVVLRNIMSNAVKFSPIGGQVRVDWKELENLLLIRISDDGPGIQEELLNSIQQGRDIVSSRGSGGEKGMGIGLRIVRTICDSRSWHFEIESKPGNGTAVTVGLPLVEPQAL